MKHSLKRVPILLTEVHYMAYQKLVAEKMNRLKEAKKDTESAIRSLNRYIKFDLKEEYYENIVCSNAL